MNAVTPKIPDHPVLLAGAVCDQLRGGIGILEAMRARAEVDDGYMLQVIEGVWSDQIDTMENHLVPLVPGRVPANSTQSCFPGQG